MNPILASLTASHVLALIVGLLALAVIAVATAPAMVASTFYNRGDRVPYSNTGSAIAEGDIVARATGTTGCVGIAVTDMAATTGTGELEINGVWICPKASGEAFTDGQLLYFDGTQLSGTSTTTSTRAGRSVGAAASADTTCKCNLNRP